MNENIKKLDQLIEQYLDEINVDRLALLFATDPSAEPTLEKRMNKWKKKDASGNYIWDRVKAAMDVEGARAEASDKVDKLRKRR